jgi:hypothetical protein
MKKIVKTILLYMIIRVLACLITIVLMTILYNTNTYKHLASLIVMLSDSFYHYQFTKDLYEDSFLTILLIYTNVLVTLNFILVPSNVLASLFFSKEYKVSLYQLISPWSFLFLIYLSNSLMIEFSIGGTLIIASVVTFSLDKFYLYRFPPYFYYHRKPLSDYLLVVRFWNNLNQGWKRVHYIIIWPLLLTSFIAFLSYLDKSFNGGMDAVEDFWPIPLLIVIGYFILVTIIYWIKDGFQNNKS